MCIEPLALYGPVKMFLREPKFFIEQNLIFSLKTCSGVCAPPGYGSCVESDVSRLTLGLNR